ncbi:hypothetical protein GUJ93_ZPchr0004g39650 [Zizania palustris]|uniref:Uncharacterized protein n=1 Tax=Zizania palustris TaxID=103762 RepID=A0A8J5SZK4_ZIZPA|nr:hypothetical protein GUJ93_ZPchr0004g39650 [Zizania palustris]
MARAQQGRGEVMAMAQRGCGEGMTRVTTFGATSPEVFEAERSVSKVTKTPFDETAGSGNRLRQHTSSQWASPRPYSAPDEVALACGPRVIIP